MSDVIVVVGGLYGESCAFPRHETIRGSGGRAALLLRSCGAKVRLITAADEVAKEAYASIAIPRGIAIDVLPRTAIDFTYSHPLSYPRICPMIPKSVHWKEKFQVGKALVFGMVEGRPQVHADSVVYDPQDGEQSEHYVSNGSRANRLAYVLNVGELFAITKQSSIESALQALRRSDSLMTIVVKRGPRGLLVCNSEGIVEVDAWPTKAVWKIGSGDVFSAAFASTWLTGEKDDIACAKFASRAAAEYVCTQADFFSRETVLNVEQDAEKIVDGPWVADRSDRRKKVYLAAPFFTTSQQWLVDELRSALRDCGLDVFSPIHDVGVGSSKYVAREDLAGLANADLVFAVLDGGDPGTVFEIGWAVANGKRIICLWEAATPYHMTMIEGSGAEIFSDLTGAVYAAAWKTSNNRG